MTGPRSLVLVHSPLVGRLTWESVGVHLRHRGHFVVVPSLADVADEGPPYHRRFAEAVAEAVAKAGCDTPAVLVGHSGAGALLPEIAELLGPDAHAAVFVDALMPHQETSWFDTAPPELGRKLVRMTRRGLLPRWHRWLGRAQPARPRPPSLAQPVSPWTPAPAPWQMPARCALRCRAGAPAPAR